ncbi:unnamed protein product [Linum tenue]|uniref:Uncharacterized protein n=1 Tax=Linum tenue TaxID=586396 RepID=A0AAV0P131_9ROSI|nr:unnamed protein product [Linum tenue]CAI0464086.1 unnamed protein product [Linum tenue]
MSLDSENSNPNSKAGNFSPSSLGGGNGQPRQDNLVSTDDKPTNFSPHESRQDSCHYSSGRDTQCGSWRNSPTW